MNGLDVLAEVRRRRPSLPVVVITGHATPDEVEQVRRWARFDVIEKPAPLTHYQLALKRLISTEHRGTNDAKRGGQALSSAGRSVIENARVRLRLSARPLAIVAAAAVLAVAFPTSGSSCVPLRPAEPSAAPEIADDLTPASR